jgi:hypothetical protein
MATILFWSALAAAQTSPVTPILGLKVPTPETQNNPLAPLMGNNFQKLESYLSGALPLYGLNIGTSRFNNICFVDGSRNVGLAGINACNSSFSRSSPGLTWIPSNAPAAPLWSTPPNEVMIVDTRFQHSFSLNERTTPEFSHIFYDFHAGANSPWEVNTGSFSGIQGIEIDGFADGGGYGDGAHAGMAPFLAAGFRTGGSRPIWGADIAAGFSNHNAPVNSLEVDSSNTGTADCPIANCTGINLISSGTKKSGIGIQVGKSGVATGFQRGLSVSAYTEIGALLQSNGHRTADVYIIPPSDDLGSAILLRNAENSTNVFRLDDSGNLTTTGSVKGQNVPIVTSFVTTSATTDNVTLTGMTVNGHCSLTPTNAGAAEGSSSVYVSNKAPNRITVAHASTSGWTFDVMCTPN